MFQRRNRTVSVGGIADTEFREHIGLLAHDAHRLKLQPAAVGAHLGPCVDKELRGGIGRDRPCRCRGRRSRRPRRRAADVRRTRADSRTARGAPPADRGHLRRRAPDTSLRMPGSVTRDGSMTPRGLDRVRFVCGIAIGFDHAERDEAIERARIQMRKPDSGARAAARACPFRRRPCHRPRSRQAHSPVVSRDGGAKPAHQSLEVGKAGGDHRAVIDAHAIAATPSP